MRLDRGRKRLALLSTRFVISNEDALAAPRARKARATLSPRSWATTVPRSTPSYLVQVVVEEFGVAGERVVLVGRLVREAEPREVHHAHPVLCAERVDHVVPVDAAGGEAVHQEQDGRIGVAELGMEDAEPLGVAAWARSGSSRTSRRDSSQRRARSPRSEALGVVSGSIGRVPSCTRLDRPT